MKYFAWWGWGLRCRENKISDAGNSPYYLLVVIQGGWIAPFIPRWRFFFSFSHSGPSQRRDERQKPSLTGHVSLFLADPNGSGGRSCRSPTPLCPAGAGTPQCWTPTTLQTRKSSRPSTLSLRAEWTIRRELSSPTSGLLLCTESTSTAVTTRLRSLAAAPPTLSLRERCLQVWYDPAHPHPTYWSSLWCDETEADTLSLSPAD